jgi:transcriptional regulator with XRE-family HTH domain
MDLQEKLLMMRRQRHLSQSDVTGHTGIAGPHLSQIETGVIRTPGLATLLSFSRFYGISLRELCELAGYDMEILDAIAEGIRDGRR